MKLVIAEFLRTLKERDELDRLIPDLLIEMGYVPLAKPQTGNRQFGVDIAARGKDPRSGNEELLLAVIKQGNIGRTEWDGNDQAIRQSINEILDVYLKSHVEPQDKGKHIHIVVVSNGELKQVVQAGWCGFIADIQSRASVEFWGIDYLAELIETHMLDEHVFRDDDRRELRRALALSGDADYDRRDLHRLFLRTLGMSSTGELNAPPKTGKSLLKALRIVSFSAHAFASWALSEGDAKQGLRGMERALTWSWHRIQLCDDSTQKEAISESFGAIWQGYLAACKNYFERVQPHCYTEDALLGYGGDSSELAVIAFELIGTLATIGLSQLLVAPISETDLEKRFNRSRIVADAMAALIFNNGICSTPCFDRHSQDITLAIMLLLFSERTDDAKSWLKKLVRNVDYSYKARKYVPISTDSLDDLPEESGWNEEQVSQRLMNSSWMLATLAGWTAILDESDLYELLAKGCRESYPNVCVQLWHPDENLYKHLYFKEVQFDCGASEAPIDLPAHASAWRDHIRTILASDQSTIAEASPAARIGIPVLDLIAYRHFSTPVAPVLWYRCVDALFPKNGQGVHGTDRELEKTELERE
ncbi:MAG: hypothetical protein ACOY7P_14540 [Pseudomonadota bacterium]